MPGLRVMSLLGLFLISSITSAQEKPLRQLIDAEIKKGWQEQKLTPAGKSSDSVFLRRVYLDLAGVVPSYQETTAFLKDTDSGKREKLIDKLLADPRYAVQQAQVWELVLFGRRYIDGTRNRGDFKKWLTDRLGKNEPFDRIVKNLLLAEEAGPDLFYAQYRNDPEEMATAVSRVFLGTQLQCARCHDHPFEPWTQKDFYGMTGFFVRLVVVDGGGAQGNKKYRIAEKSLGDVLFAGSVKVTRPGMKGEPVKPKFLGGTELKEPEAPKGFKDPDFSKANAAAQKPLFSRKEKLAEWVTAKDNSYFARAVANRVWAQFMGRGFTDPVDDLGNPRNEVSHPALLKAITASLAERKFDLKWLIREIVNTEAYQLGDTGQATDAMPKHYERARVRPLTVEELMASLRVATYYNPEWSKNTGDNAEYFWRYFGEPNDGQGRFQGSLAEHLFLNNAPMIRQFAQPRKGNLGDTLLTMKGTAEEKVDRLFLSVLSRAPTAPERDRFVSYLMGDPKMASQLVDDAIWVLLSCSEFRFNQ